MQSQQPPGKNTDKSQPTAQGSPQQSRQAKDGRQMPGSSPSTPQPAAQTGRQQRDAQSTSDNRAPIAGQGGKNKVQGEGDYESNRRYTESVKDFVESGKVDAAARDAKPRSQQEAADMRKAEQAGASHAKGGQSPSDRKSSQRG